MTKGVIELDNMTHLINDQVCIIRSRVIFPDQICLLPQRDILRLQDFGGRHVEDVMYLNEGYYLLDSVRMYDGGEGLSRVSHTLRRLIGGRLITQIEDTRDTLKEITRRNIVATHKGDPTLEHYKRIMLLNQARERVG